MPSSSALEALTLVTQRGSSFAPVFVKVSYNPQAAKATQPSPRNDGKDLGEIRDDNYFPKSRTWFSPHEEEVATEYWPFKGGVKAVEQVVILDCKGVELSTIGVQERKKEATIFRVKGPTNNLLGTTLQDAKNPSKVILVDESSGVQVATVEKFDPWLEPKRLRITFLEGSDLSHAADPR
eukprot:CAMPEP_0184305764 /NCGR_PEP_ID=MMETSP1049-20130417/14953_1 /TAXON_ID=77928 /ORGANISM="Proteomonas sulcata, Strain CCMP704" /LENGTH=179 /DNA_ID=CAMNT_0026617897 /DNA_START=246 /DNA_END=783 /DNA_ORIENTATION=+